MGLGKTEPPSFSRDSQSSRLPFSPLPSTSQQVRPLLSWSGPIRSQASSWVQTSQVLAGTQSKPRHCSLCCCYWTQEIRFPRIVFADFVQGHVILSREEHGCKLLRKPQVLNNSLESQICQETREGSALGVPQLGLCRGSLPRPVASEPARD